MTQANLSLDYLQQLHELKEAVDRRNDLTLEITDKLWAMLHTDICNPCRTTMPLVQIQKVPAIIKQLQELDKKLLRDTLLRPAPKRNNKRLWTDEIYDNLKMLA
jgi:hypothetical protein